MRMDRNRWETKENTGGEGKAVQHPQAQTTTCACKFQMNEYTC